MELIEIIQNIHPLQPDDLKLIIDITEQISVPKNTIFIEADYTSRYIYFLKEGICRIYYQKEEKEIVLGFGFTGEVITSFNSYVHGTKGYETVDSLENCMLYRTPIVKLKELYSKSLTIANWGRKLAEIEMLKIEERLMKKLFKSALERYHDLLSKEPLLLQKIKLGYIASYLGVSQVTLSRIRSGVK